MSTPPIYITKTGVLTAFMVTIGSRYNPSPKDIVSPGPAISKASVSDIGFPSGLTAYSVPLPPVGGVEVVELIVVSVEVDSKVIVELPEAGPGVGDGPKEVCRTSQTRRRAGRKLRPRWNIERRKCAVLNT